MVDLAAQVAVTAHQRPFVTEHRGEVGDHALLIGAAALGGLSCPAGDRGSRRGFRAKPAQPADRERAAQPGEPVPLRASPIARTARPAD